MGKITDYLNSILDVLKSVLNFESYKKMLLLNIIQSITSVIYFVILSIFTILLMVLFFANIKTFPENPTEWTNFFTTNFLGIAFISIFIIIGIIIFALISMYFYSSSMKLAKSIIENKTIGVKTALIEGKKGFICLVKTEILWTIIILGIIAVVLIPIVLIGLILLPSLSNIFTNPLTIITIFLIGFIILLGLIIFNILLSPFITLILPIAIFEDKGAIYTLKESFKRSKQNYFSIFFYLIIVWLIMSILSTINYLTNWVINAIGQIMILVGELTGIIGTIISYTIYFGIAVIFGLIFSSIITLFSSTLITNLYQITAKEKTKKIILNKKQKSN